MCIAITLLSILSFSSALSTSGLSIASLRSKVGFYSRNKGFLECIEHPIDCLESAGDKLLTLGSDAFKNLVSDVESDWKDLTNGLKDVESKMKTAFNNFKKFVTSEIQSVLINGLESVLKDVLKKIGSFLVGLVNSFQTEAQSELSKMESPIANQLKSTFNSAASKIKGLFSSKSTGTDLENMATSSDAQGEKSTVERTAMEAAETDTATVLEDVIEDTLTGSNILKMVGKSVELGAVFAVVDVGLLSLGYPIVVFEDRATLAKGVSTNFETDFNTYYQSAIFNTFVNVAGDFLSVIVSAISASISTSIMAAIDVASLGIGALPAAGLAFVLNFAISFVINMVLSIILKMSFHPFYNIFWQNGLSSLVSSLAVDLYPSAHALASK